MFLTIVIIKPVMGLNIEYLDDLVEGFEETANGVSTAGSAAADEARREIIKAETEAYILDIASSYNLRLEVQVTLADGEVPVPESVYLAGDAAPAAKTRLQQKIARELGIPKERQLWIG